MIQDILWEKDVYLWRKHASFYFFKHSKEKKPFWVLPDFFLSCSWLQIFPLLSYLCLRILVPPVVLHLHLHLQLLCCLSFQFTSSAYAQLAKQSPTSCILSPRKNRQRCSWTMQLNWCNNHLPSKGCPIPLTPCSQWTVLTPLLSQQRHLPSPTMRLSMESNQKKTLFVFLL